MSLLSVSAVARADSQADTVPPPSRLKIGKRKKIELSFTATLSAWSGTRRLDGTDFVAVPRLAAKLLLPLASDWTIGADADVAREQAAGAGAGSSRTRTTLREAWLGWKRGATSARLGWQIINWGRTDVVNPTDNAAARDYTRLVDRDADEKLGVPTLNLIQRFGATSVQALWQPFFRSSRFPLPLQPGLEYRDDRPSVAVTSGGLRIDTVGERSSVAVSYFHGPSKLQNLAPSLPAIVGRGELTLDHPVADIFGADTEITLGGDWLLRGETAYQRLHGSGRDPLASRESFVDTVLGIERAFGSASAFVQSEYRHTFDWIDAKAQPAFLRPFALGNAALNDELHRDRAQIGGGFALNTPDLRWSASFDFAYAPADGDWAFRPRLRWRLNDRLQVLAGGDVFRGPAAGVYGRVERNSNAFLGLSGSWSAVR